MEPYNERSPLTTAERDIYWELRNEDLYSIYCCDKCWAPFRFIWNVILTIIGTLSLLCFMLPCLLFTTIIAFITYFCCHCCLCINSDKTSLHRSRQYSPTSPTKCNRFTRIFYAKWRLLLITSRPGYKSFCCGLFYPLWLFQHYICGFYSTIEYILNSTTTPHGFKYSQIMANDLANEFGDYFPFGFGIGCGNDDRIYREQVTDCRTQLKSHTISSFDMASPLSKGYFAHGLNFMSSQDDRYFLLKDVWNVFHDNFNASNRFITEEASFKRSIVSIFNEYYGDTKVEEINKESATAIIRCVTKAVYNVMFSYDITDEEIEVVVSLSTVGIALAVIPTWMHFFLFGFLFERKLNSDCAFLRNVTKKMILQSKDNVDNVFWAKMMEYVESTNGKLDGSMLCEIMTHEVIIGTVMGTVGLCLQSLRLMCEDIDKYGTMYEENKYKYILESARFCAQLSVDTVLREDEMMVIGGNEYNIPKGTSLSVVHLMRAHNPEMFGENTDQFNARREYSLDEYTVFNCPESLYGDNREVLKENKTRFCPGHDVCIFFCKQVVDFYKKKLDDDDK